MGEGADIGVEGVPGGKLMLGGDCALEALVGGAVAACLEDAVVKRATVRGEGGGVSGGSPRIDKGVGAGDAATGQVGRDKGGEAVGTGAGIEGARPEKAFEDIKGTRGDGTVEGGAIDTGLSGLDKARDIGDRGESGALAEAKAVHAGGEADAAAGDGIVEASGIAKGGGGGDDSSIKAAGVCVGDGGGQVAEEEIKAVLGSVVQGRPRRMRVAPELGNRFGYVALGVGRDAGEDCVDVVGITNGHAGDKDPTAVQWRGHEMGRQLRAAISIGGRVNGGGGRWRRVNGADGGAKGDAAGVVVEVGAKGEAGELGGDDAEAEQAGDRSLEASDGGEDGVAGAHGVHIVHDRAGDAAERRELSVKGDKLGVEGDAESAAGERKTLLHARARVATAVGGIAKETGAAGPDEEVSRRGENGVQKGHNTRQVGMLGDAAEKDGAIDGVVGVLDVDPDNDEFGPVLEEQACAVDEGGDTAIDPHAELLGMKGVRERVARRLRQRPPDGAEDTLTNGDGADIGCLPGGQLGSGEGFLNQRHESRDRLCPLVPEGQGGGGNGGGEFAVGGEDPIGFGVAERIGQRTEVLVAVAGGTSAGAAGEVGKSMGELHRHLRRGDAGIGWEVPIPGWMLGLELIHHGGDDGRHPIGVEHAEAACDLALVDEVEGTGEGSVLVRVAVRSSRRAVELAPRLGSVGRPPSEEVGAVPGGPRREARLNLAGGATRATGGAGWAAEQDVVQAEVPLEPALEPDRVVGDTGRVDGLEHINDRGRPLHLEGGGHVEEMRARRNGALKDGVPVDGRPLLWVKHSWRGRRLQRRGDRSTWRRGRQGVPHQLASGVGHDGAVGDDARGGAPGAGGDKAVVGERGGGTADGARLARGSGPETVEASGVEGMGGVALERAGRVGGEGMKGQSANDALDFGRLRVGELREQAGDTHATKLLFQQLGVLGVDRCPVRVGGGGRRRDENWTGLLVQLIVVQLLGVPQRRIGGGGHDGRWRTDDGPDAVGELLQGGQSRRRPEHRPPGGVQLTAVRPRRRRQ